MNIQFLSAAISNQSSEFLFLYEFERNVFNSNRVYYERVVELYHAEESDAVLSGDVDYESLEETWTEYITDPDKYTEIMKLPQMIRKVYFMNRIAGYSQQEIAEQLNVSRQTIGYWIGKITKILN